MPFDIAGKEDICEGKLQNTVVFKLLLRSDIQIPVRAHIQISIDFSGFVISCKFSSETISQLKGINTVDTECKIPFIIDLGSETFPV